MKELDLDTLEHCHRAITGAIQGGTLSGDGWDQTAQRNGLILASILLAGMIEAASPKTIRIRDDFFTNPPMNVTDATIKALLARVAVLEIRADRCDAYRLKAEGKV